MTQPLTVEQLRCLELSAIIREGLEETRFDMGTYCRRREGCQTAGCIAGYTCAVYDREAWQSGSESLIVSSAEKLLGLSKNQVGQLFEPWWHEGPAAPAITPAMAADTLDRLAMTGEVVWE